MKNKKIIVGVLAAVVLIAGVCIAAVSMKSEHTHAFGDWQTLTPADCENAQLQVRRCECGEEQTQQGAPATGHTLVSISAKCAQKTPMETMVLSVDDIRVTGICECGAEITVTEGIELEGAPLVLGENTFTVKYGELTTTLTVQAEKLNLTLDGVVSDDTYVSSGSKDGDQSDKTVLKTDSGMFITYFRVNIRDILNSAVFEANRDNARVQLVLTVAGGSVTEETSFTLKAYAPAAAMTDVDFSQLTWNSVNSKEGSEGTYSQLHWSNGKVLANSAAVEDGCIVLTMTYSMIADYVDENGNILFAFGSNTEELKVASLENKNEDKQPAFKVLLNADHFHVFDQEVATQQYLCSANCKERATYYYSCACGAVGSQTFEYGEVKNHTFSALVSKVERTCTENGMLAHYRCTECGKYFVEENGEKVAVSAESLQIAAGHNCGKLIAAKDATCTEDGMKAHYQCQRCMKYFVEVNGSRMEATKEALQISATGHSYSNLIAQKDATCTEDGMKAHYRCTVCQKYFVEKDGKKVATSADSLKISAGHDYKAIAAKDATCTTDGNYKYYKCAACGKYFDAEKKETTKADQKIPAGHTFSDLIPRKEATCTEDGMKAHYRCTVCQKYFVEKDGKKVATSAESLKLSAGHDMVTAWDENHHWTACSKCGVQTDHEAHCGGTATGTERAKCEVCGQYYGELIVADLTFKKRFLFR